MNTPTLFRAGSLQRKTSLLACSIIGGGHLAASNFLTSSFTPHINCGTTCCNPYNQIDQHVVSHRGWPERAIPNLGNPSGELSASPSLSIHFGEQ